MFDVCAPSSRPTSSVTVENTRAGSPGRRHERGHAPQRRLLVEQCLHDRLAVGGFHRAPTLPWRRAPRLPQAYQGGPRALWVGMKTNLTSIGTAAVAATLLFAGAAHAQEPVDKTAPEPSPRVRRSTFRVLASASTPRSRARSAPTSTRPRSRSWWSRPRGRSSTPRSSTCRRAWRSGRSRSRPSTRSRSGSPSRPRLTRRRYSYASWLDLRTGKLILKTNAPRTETAALSKGYAGVIEQQEEAFHDDFSRKSDIAPFWGGNSIKSGGGVCSSSFVVKKPSGTRFLATAGHCFAPRGERHHDEQQRRRRVRDPARPDPAVRHGADRRQVLRLPHLRGRRRQLVEQARGGLRRPGRRLHELLPQRPDDGREVRPDGVRASTPRCARRPAASRR